MTCKISNGSSGDMPPYISHKKAQKTQKRNTQSFVLLVPFCGLILCLCGLVRRGGARRRRKSYLDAAILSLAGDGGVRGEWVGGAHAVCLDTHRVDASRLETI